MAQKIMYKFSITNLILVNSVYPFDFFLRVHTANAQQPQDSPIIQANSFQCDQLFPWEFAVTSIKLNVQFIEISTGQNQIVKSQIVIGNATVDNGETVPMLANRTGKKICFLSYKLQPYAKMPINSSRSKDKNKSPNYFQQNWDPATIQISPQKKNKIIFTKQQHEQLSKQIANINKSIDKILDNEKSQHAIFNKYLQQSTSFIKQVMNQSKNNYMNKTNSYRMNDIQQQQQDKGNVSQILKQVREENQSPNTSHQTSNIFGDQVNLNSWKWYRNKFNKNKPHISKNINYRKQSDANIIAAVFQPSLQYSQQYSKDNSNNQISILLSDISINSELKPSQVSFLQPKNQKLIMKMTSSKGPIYEWKKPIQLPKLDTVLISIADINNKNQIKGCIAKKQFQKQRVSLYDKNGTQKGFMKFKAKILGTFAVQTQQLSNQSRVNLSNSKQQQKLQKLQTQQHIQEAKKQQKKEQIRKQIQLPNKIQNIEPKIEIKQKSPPKQKVNQQKQDKQNKELQKIYKLDKVEPFRRPSRIRKRSSDQDENKPIQVQSQKQQMENKQQHKSPNPKQKFQLVSGSVSASFLPFMKKYSISQKVDTTPFMSDQQVSDIASSQNLSRIKLVNFKVDSVSIKMLTKNTNDYIGKFIKLSMRNKTPYITQTINLSQNLTWRGKGFIFQSASPYAQLIIQLFNEQKNQHILIGKAKICLALLNLHKSNQVQIYSDYIRDEDQNQIAQLILGYESLDKQKKKGNSLKRRKKLQMQDIQINYEQKKKKNKLRVRGKSQDLQLGSKQKTENQMPKSIGLQGSQAKSIVGSSSVIRTKKYNGGNIIIGRAARFRAKNPTLPGPGQYQMPSGFQRHVFPL